MARLFPAGSGGPVMDESMDERIFQQLEQLQRGENVGAFPQRDDRSGQAQAPYSAQEVHSYINDAARHETGQEDFADQPQTLDSFGMRS